MVLKHVLSTIDCTCSERDFWGAKRDKNRDQERLSVSVLLYESAPLPLFLEKVGGSVSKRILTSTDRTPQEPFKTAQFMALHTG
jgi:hypothetical protein